MPKILIIKRSPDHHDDDANKYKLHDIWIEAYDIPEGDYITPHFIWWFNGNRWECFQ